MLPSDDTDATNATVTTIIIIVGPRRSSVTWEQPDWSAFNKECEWPDECKAMEIERDDRPAFSLPAPEAVQRDTRFKRPPQQASAYG